MKKSLHVAAMLCTLTLLLGLGTGRVFARLTGTEPGTDIHCVGPSGAEVCVDVSGNFLPTTDNDTTLGTSALRFATVYAYDLAASDDLTVTDDATVSDDLTVTGDSFKTMVATVTVTAGATISVAGACGGVLRLNATDDRTTDTTDTLTAPASANAGCVLYIVNQGGGAITLDNNAKFSCANADRILGTRDGITVVQTGSMWVCVGSSEN